MRGDADLAGTAALIGERTRARFLLELLDGRSLRASELAALAGISRATASFHLDKLLGAKMLAVDPHGRNRAYRLADPQVAEAIEALARIAPREQTHSLATTTAAEKLAYARFCYDHLAGALAIKLVDALADDGLLTPAEERFELTDRGARRLSKLDIDAGALHAERRSFARSCLDWSERKPHLAGALGAALANRFLDLEWIKREPKGRAVTLTQAGRAGLAETFGLQTSADQAPAGSISPGARSRRRAPRPETA